MFLFWIYWDHHMIFKKFLFQTLNQHCCPGVNPICHDYYPFLCIACFIWEDWSISGLPVLLWRGLLEVLPGRLDFYQCSFSLVDSELWFLSLQHWNLLKSSSTFQLLSSLTNLQRPWGGKRSPSLWKPTITITLNFRFLWDVRLSGPGCLHKTLMPSNGFFFVVRLVVLSDMVFLHRVICHNQKWKSRNDKK